MHALGSLHSQSTYPVTHILGEGDGGRFLKQFLIAALQRAFTFTQMKHLAIVISHNLYLDMTGTADIMLEIIFCLSDIH